jgi:putative two-component system response regulator
VCYKALQAGATDFLTKPVDKNEFIARIRNMAALRRSQKLLADRAALLASEVAAATKMIAAREREIIFCLAKAAEYRDPETGGPYHAHGTLFTLDCRRTEAARPGTGVDL